MILIVWILLYASRRHLLQRERLHIQAAQGLRHVAIIIIIVTIIIIIIISCSITSIINHIISIIIIIIIIIIMIIGIAIIIIIIIIIIILIRHVKWHGPAQNHARVSITKKPRITTAWISISYHEVVGDDMVQRDAIRYHANQFS